MPLTHDERKSLLTLARETIVHTVHRQSLPPIDLDGLPEVLCRPGAAFVTLTKFGQLRGCIGSLEARRPLALDVRENAIGAALHDPRFPPVNATELNQLHVEVSVLSEPQPLNYTNREDLIAKLRPGVDGVIIERGWHRATFLPQVWEKLPDPDEFLEHLCLKASLPADAYRRSDLQVSVYQVESFDESGS
ncbi:MAG: AmmeMemoRadiSam system protein A [Anaerolineales bacterium]|nr:AmmeMemoRadiSam system protein A [Anaerolineales bacterium]